MSVYALGWAFRQECTPTEKLVLLALADQCYGETGQCWPAMETVAVKTGLCRRTVVTKIEGLINRGLVSISRRYEDGRKRSHIYTLEFHPKPAVEHDLPESTENRCANDDTNEPSDVQTAQVRCANDDILDVQDLHIESGYKQPVKATGKKKPPVIPLVHLGRFQKVALSEVELEKLTKELGEERRNDLVERLDGYIASTGRRYKSHYATILNWNRKDIAEGKYKKNEQARDYVKETEKIDPYIAERRRKRLEKQAERGDGDHGQ